MPRIRVRWAPMWPWAWEALRYTYARASDGTTWRGVLEVYRG